MQKMEEYPHLDALGVELKEGKPEKLNKKDVKGQIKQITVKCEKAVSPFLIDVETEDEIPITNADKSLFLIGKSKDCNLIIDINSISRKHAAIIKKGDNYSIKDFHSTNHTFVNHDRLPSGQSRELTGGEVIGLALKKYTFVLK